MENLRRPLTACIAPHFNDLHWMLKREELTEAWLRGGRGSTKSSFISIEIILGILKDPNANAVVFRRFENEIGDSVYAQLEWACNMLGVYNEFKFYKSPRKIEHLETKQVILFKGADNPKKIKSIKLATGYVKYAWFEEVDQFGGMAEIRNILQSVFRGTTKKQIAFYSYNPPKSARSWVNEETRVPKEGRFVSYSDYRTVPVEWLGDTFISNAEHLKETNEEAYKHEYLGLETGTGLEVFNNVELRPITDKEISYFDYRYQGLDFGYAADPLCFEEFHFDTKKRILYLFSEISGHNLKNAQFASMLSEDQRTEVTMADAAEPKSIDELREDHKVNIMPAEKSPGSVEHGIKWLQDLEQIVIDPVRCPLASSEFINYALDVNRWGDVISKYPDKDNHCFIGETMVSTIDGATRIDELKAGDLVKTRKGFYPVTKIFKNELPVVTTKLLNGKSLTLTDTHAIITKQGDVMFKDLTPFDTVYYEDDLCTFIETGNRKWLYILERNIGVTRKAREGMIKYTSKGQLRQEQMNTSMWQFMKLTMGRFLMGITFTIEMGILSIIKWITCPVWTARNIWGIIQKNTMKAIKKLSEKILTGFALLRKHGMLPRKVESGTLSMQKKSLGVGQWWNWFVSVVEEHILLMNIQRKETLDSAPINAKQNGEEIQGLTTRKGCARIVGSLSRRTNTAKQSSVVLNVQPVFDVEVSTVHEYFANGLLVHNSLDSVRYGCSNLIKQARVEKRKAKFKARPIPTIKRWKK